MNAHQDSTPRSVIVEALVSATPPLFEAHRAYIRELNLQAQRAYTFGGLASLLAASVFPLAAAMLGSEQLLTPLPWLAAISAGLVTLYFARRAILRRIDTLKARLMLYCIQNEFDDMQALILYFADHGYPFMSAFLPRAR